MAKYNTPLLVHGEPHRFYSGPPVSSSDGPDGSLLGAAAHAGPSLSQQLAAGGGGSGVGGEVVLQMQALPASFSDGDSRGSSSHGVNSGGGGVGADGGRGMSAALSPAERQRCNDCLVHEPPSAAEVAAAERWRVQSAAAATAGTPTFTFPGASKAEVNAAMCGTPSGSATLEALGLVVTTSASSRR